MICIECGIKMVEKSGKSPNNMDYTYYECGKCRREDVEMKQLDLMIKKSDYLKKKAVKPIKKIKLDFSKLNK